MPIVFILFLAFVYGYLNGQYGSATIVSTIVSTRAMRPRFALLLSFIGMALGSFLLGTSVTTTISADLIANDTMDVYLVPAAFVASILWSGLMLWFKLPISTSQAVIWGLVGAAWAGYGLDVLLPSGIAKVAIGVVISPLFGMFCGYVLVVLCYVLGQTATPRLNRWLQRGQVLASFSMAVVFGSNEAQKMMGLIVLGLINLRLLHEATVPEWVLIFTIAARGLGSAVGGWRIMHTMGNKFYRLRAVHGFGAQASSTAVILFSSIFGLPISGSQVVTSAIVGAGTADRLQKVRWLTVQDILLGWVLTIPLSVLTGAAAYAVMKGLFA